MPVHFKSALIIFLTGLLCLCGRSRHGSQDAADPEFVNAYIDLLYLQERHARPTPAIEDSMKFILEKHHLTQERFSLTLHKLNEKPEYWEPFLQEVLDQLNSIDTTRIVKLDPVKVLSELKQQSAPDQTKNKPQDK